MKLSEVFRKAAETAFKYPNIGWQDCLPWKDDEAKLYFQLWIGDEFGDPIEPRFGLDCDHRSTALCMAASIAESEGL